MIKKYHIVLTTINVPTVVEDLYENLSRYYNLTDTKVWVIGDVQTPIEAKTLCEQVTDKGLESIYLDIDEQDQVGNNFQEFYQRLPLKNECRRNIGYLAAWHDGAETLISIDDDNFPLEDDFIGGHSITGSNCSNEIYSDKKGYYNICEHLEMEPARHVYPRGFPFHLRDTRNEALAQQPVSDHQIGVNAGLWLKDPDIDATTWLNGTVRGTQFKGPAYTTLSQETWSPINTQNTSITRELMPAYICVPMGWNVPGGKINRYGDIWGGYFLQALMKNTNYLVSFGDPVVDHRRNPHNYLDDLRGEYWGLLLTDWLLENLKDGFQPSQDEIIPRISELSEFIRKITKDNLPAWCPEEIKGFLIWTSDNLDAWQKSFK